MNQHWEQFIEDITWFTKNHQTIEVSAARPPGSWQPTSSDFARLFPELDRLLRSAFVTSVATRDAKYELYAWSRRDNASCAWLAPLRSSNPPSSIYPDHRVLLASFGGILENSNAPDEDEEWWILNHNAALTEALSHTDATFIEHYAWAFEEAGVKIPIELQTFYAIAEEANGNTTLCHRHSGEVVLFAPDHAFDHVKVYPGCPAQSLYLLNGAPRFRGWVETTTRQWRQWVDAE
jgi:hypothetical protein